MCLTTVFVKDVREAVQDAVTTAAVGASFLNPFAMRNQTTAPTDKRRTQKHDVKQLCLLVRRRCDLVGVHLMRWSYSQFLPVKNRGQAQKLPRIQVPPFLQQLRL